MSYLLFIDACARPNSRTRELAEHILASLDGRVERCELYSLPLAPLDNDGIEERHRASASGDFSAPRFLLAKQFALADTILIAAPYWDLTFPAALKLYLETVTVSGLTFKYSEQGVPHGLCRAKKLLYVTTAGGFIGENAFGFSYVKALAQGFFGISDVRCFSAEGLDAAPERAAQLLSDAKREAASRL